MTTLKITVTYDYLSPSPAGPYKGRMEWLRGPPPKRGQTIAAPFGVARVRSVRRTANKA